MDVIHQLEIQRRGGVCSSYPSSCLVRDLLAKAKLFKPFDKIRVLDLCYGQGIFYYTFKNAVQVYAFDIRRLNWVTKPYKFYNKSCEHWKNTRGLESETIDLVTVDPPFSPYYRSKEKRGHYKDNGNMSLCLYEGLNASEYYNAAILIHFPWKTYPYGYRVLSEVWFQGWSRNTKMPKPTWFGVVGK